MGFTILGQIVVGTSELALYTVTAGLQAITSQIDITNNVSGGAQVKVNVNFRKGGATLAAQHKTFQRIPVPDGNPTVIPGGQTLAAGDVISVSCDTASGAVVTVFGQEMPA